MLTLDLVRHADPDWAPEGHVVAEPILSDLGCRQAERLADVYADDSVTHFYTSPMVRAMQTAAAVGKVLGRDASVLDWAKELAIPDLTGKPREDLTGFFLEYRRQPLSAWWQGFEVEERYEAFFSRVASGLDGLLASAFGSRDAGDAEDRLYTKPDMRARILLVAHAGTISCLTCHLLGFRAVPWIYEKLALGYTGICRFRMIPLAGHWMWSLVTFNDRYHLDDETFG